MIEEIAIVTRIDNDRVWIKSRQSGGCGGCFKQDSCGTATMAKLLPKREFPVDCAMNVQIGDQVRVAIDDSYLLFGSFLLYLLPLVIMLTGVGLASTYLPQAIADDWLPETALTILTLTFWLLHHFQKRLLLHFCLKPTIVAEN